MVSYKPWQDDEKKVNSVKDIPGILGIVSANRFSKEDC